MLEYTAFWGGRSSCKRSLLVRHGLFHPDFRFGCEDIELGWRLARYGLRVIYTPCARSVMIRALTFDQFCARSYRQGRSQANRYLVVHWFPREGAGDGTLKEGPRLGVSVSRKVGGAVDRRDQRHHPGEERVELVLGN